MKKSETVLLATETAADRLESLGNSTRLAIFKLLVKAGDQGLAVGELQAKLEIPGSTLSHHLSHLAQRDLIYQRREGRILRCVANYLVMNELVNFLTVECCTGFGE